MKMIERLKRFFKPKEKKADELLERSKVQVQDVQKLREEVSLLDKEIERLREGERRELEKLERLSRRVSRPPGIVHSRIRQPISQTYTGKKVRGLPPRSAFQKRMWKLQTSKEELEQL